MRAISRKKRKNQAKHHIALCGVILLFCFFSFFSFCCCRRESPQTRRFRQRSDCAFKGRTALHRRIQGYVGQHSSNDLPCCTCNAGLECESRMIRQRSIEHAPSSVVVAVFCSFQVFGAYPMRGLAQDQLRRVERVGATLRGTQSLPRRCGETHIQLRIAFNLEQFHPAKTEYSICLFSTADRQCLQPI